MARYSKFHISPLVIVLISLILVQGVVIVYLLIHQKRVGEEIVIRVKPAKAPEAKRVEKPKLALKAQVGIVLDDWGYNIDNFAYLDKIDVPLTLSILPSQKFTQAISRYVQKRGWQAMLHLPLEPLVSNEYSRLEPDTILVKMNEREIRKILNKQLASVEGITGVSNHMGSKATANEKTMDVVLKTLAEKKLFFFDSIVTSASVCKKEAEKLKVGFASRDIFLDNEQNYDYIAGQLDKLISLAKAKGKAIGVGHDRKTTLMVLSDRLSNFDSDKEGVRFIFVSEILH